MAELTDAQKVMRNDTGKSIAEAIANMSITVAGQEIEVSDTEPQSRFVDVWFQEQQQGTPVEVYTVPEIDSMRTQLESNLAHINTGSTADKLYQPGEYLVYNGQLYKVGNTAIGPGETLTVGGNISVPDGGGLNDVLNTAKGRNDILYSVGSGTQFTSGSLTVPDLSKYSVIAIVMTNGVAMIANVQTNAIVSGGVATNWNSDALLTFGINYARNADTISINSDRRGYSDGTTSNYNGNAVGIRSIVGLVLN